MLAFKRNHPSLFASLRFILYVAGGSLAILVLSSDSSFVTALTFIIILTLMIPVFILIILQGSYWIHGWFKYGDPFHRETQPYVYETVVRKEVKQRAWCHICKENTGCRVSRNPVTRTLVHVINGGGRPRKM